MPKLLSASRLNEFLGCAHRAALWLEGVEPPEDIDATLELVRAKGFEHEARVLVRLESEHGTAARISEDEPLEGRLGQTWAAMREGEPLIYQAALVGERWLGFPDFLVRIGKFGDRHWAYRAEDAKLARRASAEHVLQLGVYAELLAEVAGGAPEHGVIHSGAGKASNFDLRRTRHAARRLMERFEAFAGSPERQTRAIRCAACARCAFQARCRAEWRAADSLVFVAGVRNDQIAKLDAAGVTRLADLAACDPDEPLGGVGAEAFARLVRQASLQKRAAEAGEKLHELLPLQPGRGFQLLPKPEAGELFFDIEGDPLVPEGLEYLFGLWGPFGAGDEDGYRAFWAHDRAEEKRAFEALMDLFGAHLARFPKARIFHYAPYEPTALKRLAMSHATREAELDQLLRDSRFVDLYGVVRQSVRTSEEGLSLKDLEKIYWGGRAGDVTNAGDSIVQYERWRETGDSAILEAIERYNADDVVSTARLRDWLESLRPAGADFLLRDVKESEGSSSGERASARVSIEAERQDLAAAAVAGPQLTPPAARLAADLIWFHLRSQKPQWWAHFDRQTWCDEDLVDDIESIGAVRLHPGKPVRREKGSHVAAYRFPPQETKRAANEEVSFALGGVRAGRIVGIDPDIGEVVISRGVGGGDFPSTGSLIPGPPIDLKPLVEGVAGFANRLARGGAEPALVDVLERRRPRIEGLTEGEPIIRPGADLVEGAIQAALRLQNSCLVVQGPPGAGKTHTAAHMILALLRDGGRVAISSNAHKAIDNLLWAVEEHGAAGGVRYRGAKFDSRAQNADSYRGRRTRLVRDRVELAEADLVGATAFHLARSEAVGAFDHLFIDEAGQVSLGNLVAMGGCARNIVLVGDQMQLAQPVQGVHPGESGLSCLDYLMAGEATVHPDRGVLLDVSYRMHSRVCRFISETYYGGRLTSHPDTDGRRLALRRDHHPAIAQAGVTVLEVDHVGCAQSSIEEARAVATLVDSLLLQELALENGTTRRLGLDDILVVAPFNAQVNLLARTLPAGARVGTVDRFQGQQAAVSVISMATSNGAEAPRGTGFLFDRNRLNVAASRAQCLAVIVRSAGLLDFSPASIEDLERLEGFARADAESGR